jgi:hypothetical protein
MVTHGAFKTVPKDKVPTGAKVLSSTWAVKKKANGTCRARLNARGYEQIDGEHCDENEKFAPIVSDVAIHIVLIMIAMTGWWAELLDVKGAFLCGVFEKGRQMFMATPQGFEKFCPMNVVLLLLKTVHGTKQAARAFWNESLKVFCDVKCTRNKADPFSHFVWTTLGTIIWLSWVDDCLICGNKEGAEKAKKQMIDRFDCDEVGELKECVGCEIDRALEDGSVKLTQPVLLQSYDDEFDLPKGETPNTPAIPGTALHKGRTEDAVNEKEKELFAHRSGVWKLLHMMKWTRPEILNAVRELSRFMSGATQEHMKAMHRTLNCWFGTPSRGLSLKPTVNGTEIPILNLLSMEDRTRISRRIQRDNEV